MATDYILFVHGVRIRQREAFEKEAGRLFDGIRRSIPSTSNRKLQPIYFFWGDLNNSPLKQLEAGFKASSQWRKFWFRDFRTEQVMEFAGDAALYLSRHIGSEVVRRFRREALGTLKQGDTGDRLHFVTHSWGTVVLFDLLFAGRWDDERLAQNESTKDIPATIQEIRNALFGLPPNPGVGLPLASIHTLGSPLALFSLLTVTGQSSHDLTPRLKLLLENLFSLRNSKIPWRNFSHPGDPIAYPLEGVIPTLLDGTSSYVEVQDLITNNGNPINLPVSQTLLPILWGGEAHGSYWGNELVWRAIGDAIRQTGN